MALGFQSTPVNWDHSNIILSNNAGARIGAGMQQAAQGLAMGIEGWSRRKREDEALKRAMKEAEDQRKAIEQRAKGLTQLAKTAPELFGGPQQAQALLADLEDPNMPPEAKYGRLQGELDAAGARRELERWTLKQQQDLQRAQMEAAAQAALRGAVTPRPTQGPLRPEILDANQAWNASPVSDRYMQAVAQGAPLDPAILEITAKLDSTRSAAQKPKPGQTLDVDGTRMVWTGAQYEALRKPKEERPLYPEGPRIIERDGVKFYQVGPQHEPRPVSSSGGLPSLSEAEQNLLNNAQTTAAKARAELSKIDAEIAAGTADKPGFFGKSRTERRDAALNQLAQVEPLIAQYAPRARFGGSAAAALGQPVTEPTEVAVPASPTSLTEADATSTFSVKFPDPERFSEGDGYRIGGKLYIKRGAKWVLQSK